MHAHAGKILNRYSMVNDALFRRLFEISTATQVWQEGDAFPGALNQDQQNIVTASGHSYNFFFNAFARDSYDGAGAEMQSVNNDPTIACPERELERRDHQLLQRRHGRRCRRARMGPRLHRVHARPDLPMAVGCAQ